MAHRGRPTLNLMSAGGCENLYELRLVSQYGVTDGRSHKISPAVLMMRQRIGLIDLTLLR